MERTTWPEIVPLSTDRQRRVMEELVQGREMTSQLRDVIGSDDVTLSEGLVTKIMGSLTNTLVMLNESNESNAVVTSDSAVDVINVGEAVKPTEENCKRAETLKDRRGSHKRRKNSYSWTKETLYLVNDGHPWRKYGQKTIHNTKHPRSYFRCTHKFEQGCKSTKHVQKIKDEPQLYRTTYYANHTCTDYLEPQEFVLDCSSQEDSPQKNMIRFDSIDSSASKQEHPFFKDITSIKPFLDEQGHLIHENQATSLSSGSLASQGQGVLEAPGEPFNGFSSMLENDHEIDLFYSMMVEYFDEEADFLYKL